MRSFASQLQGVLNSGYVTVFVIQVALLAGSELIRVRALRRARRQHRVSVTRRMWAREIWAMGREDSLLAAFALVAAAGGLLARGNALLDAMWTGQNGGFYAVGLVGYLVYVAWRTHSIRSANTSPTKALRLSATDRLSRVSLPTDFGPTRYRSAISRGRISVSVAASQNAFCCVAVSSNLAASSRMIGSTIASAPAALRYVYVPKPPDRVD